ncbi:MAG: citrate synthase/methylcitrate synthase [Deltaproteobacteria bacterium]|nr:citrate synthase/methylcitrate synthase [Deltaproteobacteria bacterium]
METRSAKPSSNGLEGVVAAETRLSDVDGERGKLTIAGHDVERLALAATFEDACALLADGHLPDAAGRARWKAQLGQARVEAFAQLEKLGDALDQPDGMDALRSAVAHLRPGDRGTLSEAARVIGATSYFAAAWARKQAGLPALAPDPDRSAASDYLRLVRGAEPSPAEVQGLDAYLVTVVDHGMNASTFTARVVASTGSDRVSAIVAALGALKGPLHGGAPGPVLDMLDAVGSPARAEAWLEAELKAGRRIMGMGHRIYRVRDPRAAVLERAIERLEKSGTSTGRLALARAVEQAAEGALRARHPDRPLAANVEFYTAVLLDTLGLPRTLFSPTFAVGRVAGWSAHVDEQRAVGKLIRPQSKYVGPLPS